MPLRSTLLQWNPAHVYISASRHSQRFRLNLAQIISGLKAVTFYVHGSGMHGLCTDPIFLDFIYIVLYYLCFSLGHQNPPLPRKLSVNYSWFSKEILVFKLTGARMAEHCLHLPEPSSPLTLASHGSKPSNNIFIQKQIRKWISVLQMLTHLNNFTALIISEFRSCGTSCP